MARITMVRHGEAAAGFTDDRDPGLSELGRSQASAVASALADGPAAPFVSSPLGRCRETAAPLAARWGTEVMIEPRVTEIPSPTDDLAERGSWLRQVMAGTWSDADAALQAWVDDLVAALVECDRDTIVFSHFVAVNAAIGRAIDDDRVVQVRVGNGSRTVFDNDGGRLRVVEWPDEVTRTDVR